MDAQTALAVLGTRVTSYCALPSCSAVLVWEDGKSRQRRYCSTKHQLRARDELRTLSRELARLREQLERASTQRSRDLLRLRERQLIWLSEVYLGAEGRRD